MAAVAWAFAGLPGPPAPCPAAGCDCEAPRPGPIRQPANAWSSLGLAAAGVVLLGAPYPRHATGYAAAAALAASGTVAFVFHAGLTAWAARLDGLAVGALVAALAAHGWYRLRAGPRSVSRAAGVVPWTLLALGSLCWVLGRSGGPWCRPESLLQAHAAWHLLAAAALFLWLRREPPRRRGASAISPRPLASGREEPTPHEPPP